MERTQMLKLIDGESCVDEVLTYREILAENITLRLMLLRLTEDNNACDEMKNNENDAQEQNVQTTKNAHNGENEKKEEKIEDEIVQEVSDQSDQTKNDKATNDEKKEVNEHLKTNSGEYVFEIFCRYEGYLNHHQLREIYSRYGDVKVKNVPGKNYALIRYARFQEAVTVIREGTIENRYNVRMSCNWSNHTRKTMKMEVTMNDLTQTKKMAQPYAIANRQQNNLRLGSVRPNPFRVNKIGTDPVGMMSEKQKRSQRRWAEVPNASGNGTMTMEETQIKKDKGEYEVTITVKNTNMNTNETKWVISNKLEELLNRQNVLYAKRINNDVICTIGNMTMDRNKLRGKLNSYRLPWEWIYTIVERMEPGENRKFFRGNAQN